MSSKSVVITQSNYIPWKGYFDVIQSVDELILLDCVQFTRRDWRNRNIIKTPNGPLWLTIPVDVKGRFHQAIDETTINQPNWAAAHIRSIESSYRRAAKFDEVAPWLFGAINKAGGEPMLSAVNQVLLQEICTFLGIQTPIRHSSDVLAREKIVPMEPTQRLLELCQALGATRYVSGPAAKDYLDVARFNQKGIDVVWADYSGYPEYPQLWGAFDHRVSVIDLLLNVGREAPRFMKYF